MRTILIIAALSLISCDQKPTGKGPENKSEAPATHRMKSSVPELPESIEALIDGIIEAMPEERKVEIRKAESAEQMVDHFGMGMELRNEELSQRDSEVVNYLTRMGIFHPDDYSSIVLLSVNRRLRGEPIDLMAQIQEVRDCWSEQDIVAPLDLACPSCKKEMEVVFLGKGVSDQYPERTYFHGRCRTHGGFIYYHSDGWISWSPPMPKGEQDGASDGGSAASLNSGFHPAADGLIRSIHGRRWITRRRGDAELEENGIGNVIVDRGVPLHQTLGRHHPEDQWPRGRSCILTRSHEDTKVFPPAGLLRVFA